MDIAIQLNQLTAVDNTCTIEYLWDDFCYKEAPSPLRGGWGWVRSTLATTHHHPCCPLASPFSLKGKEVLIYAALDCRRNPAWVRERVTKQELR